MKEVFMTVSKGAYPSGERGDRLVQDDRQDPYMRRQKLQEPSFCAECGAVFHGGRWQWSDKSDGAEKATCPACQRIKDDCEAGIVILKGAYYKGHRQEILNIVRNEEKKEKGQHPLHRVMQIEEDEGSATITTTDIHLPKRIGESVRHAHQGELALDYDEDGYYVRVTWDR